MSKIHLEYIYRSNYPTFMTKYAENYMKIPIRSFIEAGIYKHVKSHTNFCIQMKNKKYLNAYITPSEDGFHITLMHKCNYWHLQIIHTYPNYGGRRAWFICPITGEKCTVLYWKERELGSRKGLNLRYLGEFRDPLFLYFDVRNDYTHILETIKYPYRSGKPTRKFKKVIRGFKKAGLTEQHAHEHFFQVKSDLEAESGMM